MARMIRIGSRIEYRLSFGAGGYAEAVVTGISDEAGRELAEVPFDGRESFVFDVKRTNVKHESWCYGEQIDTLFGGKCAYCWTEFDTEEEAAACCCQAAIEARAQDHEADEADARRKGES